VGNARLFHADCRDVLRSLADNSIHSVVCDPPYALVSIQKRFGKPGSAPAKDVYGRGAAGFMGKQWDTGEVAFSDEFWAEVLRVLKPGGHVVAFGGTRTYHRMAVAIEDAGFEIRDQIGWAFGSGFPKSHNQHGDWEGWGSALKPAWEPICMARKPLDGTIAENLVEWGVGAINVDGCRVATEEDIKATRNVSLGSSGAGVFGAANVPGVYEQKDGGRWPANIAHDGSDEVLAAFPSTAPSKAGLRGIQQRHDVASPETARPKEGTNNIRGIDDNGGSAARFFYCAKASRADRDAGLDHLPKKPPNSTYGDGLNTDTKMRTEAQAEDGVYRSLRANTHPTVKPTSLMQWLCRLITPPGGIILDPFMGSGSTGKAAVLEGFQFIGCEREDEYMPIAQARIQWAVDELQRPAVAQAQPAARSNPANDNSPIGDLFAPSQAGAA
jgi:site-specific DNA-methyltransferase (adenine-specific)